MDKLTTEVMQPLSISKSPAADGTIEDLPPAMRRPTFVAPTPSCHWLSSTWSEIRGEVNNLIKSVDATVQSIALSPESLTNVIERKRALETATRRRTRVVEEMWCCFVSLQRVHTNILNGNSTSGQDTRSCSSVRFHSPLPSNQAFVPERTNSNGSASGDVIPLPLGGFQEETLSVLDMVSKTLIRCGVECELYDEESSGVTRIAGAGLGLAVLAVICTYVYYSDK